MVTQPIESHEVHSERLLNHAREMLASGDRLQASEKTWGAVAHAVKALADERGWPYLVHQDAGVITSHIAQQVGNHDFETYFAAVENLHRNFYEDVWELDVISRRLSVAEQLLALLKAANETMPRDLPMPTDSRYRNRVERFRAASQEP
ncbi:MAG: hypothetical protein OXL97_04990 [Chloroflexota bacterium]|nr:hypothetical protein [Chloroflexota bacterium]MDE2885773.1 hypothetical protein [Chloroflexota bacterium]